MILMQIFRILSKMLMALIKQSDLLSKTSKNMFGNHNICKRTEAAMLFKILQERVFITKYAHSSSNK